MTAKKDRLDKGAIVQRDMTTYAVAPHIPGGIILDSNVLRKLADVADKYGAQALKITTAQRIAIVGLKEEDLDNVWKDLDMSPGHALGSCVRSVRICPATTFCKRAKQDAVSLGLEIDKLYHGMPLPSKFKIAVSGCQNSCSVIFPSSSYIMNGTVGLETVVLPKSGMSAPDMFFNTYV